MAVEEEALDLKSGRVVAAVVVRSLRRRKSGAWVAECEIDVTGYTADGRLVVCQGGANVRGAQRGKRPHPKGCKCVGCTAARGGAQ